MRRGRRSLERAGAGGRRRQSQQASFLGRLRATVVPGASQLPSLPTISLHSAPERIMNNLALGRE